ncbi:MAG: ParB family transcriptional regulator, chromosome partitioning protein [Frankiaceae bacterium]|jgi:ParB family chromosome partitioning protein|nr:ParB family transcriptional regulator, chromosome partitioning protein [Frankiaceae bacterium]
MSARRGGLGRGLGALIPAAAPATSPVVSRETPAIDGSAAELVAIPGVTLAELNLNEVDANPGQPRTNFDDDALAELADSIREVGVLQPIVVRPLSSGRYQIVMGERRYRASKLAGQTTVPAIIRATADDNLLRDALLENLHRAQLNPLEEAAAYRQLLDDFGATHEQLAQRVGKSRAHVSNTLRLMNLSAKVQHRVAAGVLSAGHARALLGLEDSDAQDRLAARIVAEGLSVRAVEEIVAMQDVPDDAPRVRRTKPRTESAAAGHVAAALAERLDTRVRVDVGRGKGKITIEFGGEDDLERIAALLQG